VVKGRSRAAPTTNSAWPITSLNISNPTIEGPLQTTKLLRDEYGFEAFYNIALTPWLLLTRNLQIIRDAQKDKINVVQGLLGGAPANWQEKHRQDHRVRRTAAGGVLGLLIDINGTSSDRFELGRTFMQFDSSTTN